MCNSVAVVKISRRAYCVEHYNKVFVAMETIESQGKGLVTVDTDLPLERAEEIVIKESSIK
jgi:hypothetical protein